MNRQRKDEQAAVAQSIASANVRVTQRPGIGDLRAEARYHRERYDLYRAKMYAGRPTTMSRLRELERVHQGAEARLRQAEQQRASHRHD